MIHVTIDMKIPRPGDLIHKELNVHLASALHCLSSVCTASLIAWFLMFFLPFPAIHSLLYTRTPEPAFLSHFLERRLHPRGGFLVGFSDDIVFGKAILVREFLELR